MPKQVEMITVVTGKGVIQYKVGEKVGPQRKEIAAIVDNSIEYPDRIHQLYWLYDAENNLIMAIENCPAIVMYK